MNEEELRAKARELALDEIAAKKLPELRRQEEAAAKAREEAQRRRDAAFATRKIDFETQVTYRDNAIATCVDSLAKGAHFVAPIFEHDSEILRLTLELDELAGTRTTTPPYDASIFQIAATLKRKLGVNSQALEQFVAVAWALRSV